MPPGSILLVPNFGHNRGDEPCTELPIRDGTLRGICTVIFDYYIGKLEEEADPAQQRNLDVRGIEWAEERHFYLLYRY